MRKLQIIILLSGFCVAPCLYADEADDKDAAMQIGIALGWRLSPEAVEERCREADPAGIEIRKTAVGAWLKLNAKQIQAVDSRVDEIVPILYTPPPTVNALTAVRAQIKQMLLETIFDGKTAAQATAICKSLTDTANPEWNNSGMPMVQESLAALYDWKIKQAAK